MKRFFTSWWTLTILAALIVALILSVGLPFFVAWMRPLWVRIAFAFGVVAIWGLCAFLRWRRAKRAEAAIAAELAGPNAADEESRALATRMREALAGLKAASRGNRNYLYAKPWYVIIGPPGAGKTTALLNSGLRFPLAEQALGGVGGTRNLDFWFADEAAMVDTAGRYTTQDSDRTVDARGWTSFLALMKKHRPLQPINGVIVAIGVDELIRSSVSGIDAHAAAVRRRLAELRRELEVAAPVYVLLTKADLLAGFTEYYADLDVEGRRAVLGSTLPFTRDRPRGDALAAAFDEMAQAVADRQAKRLFEENDAARRALLIGFPSQLQSLRSRLMRFLDGAFVSGDEPGGVLRGFYLTSGVQQGAPLDRILSGMADVYDRPQEPRAAGSGRAYFLNRLLAETMFPEAGLVRADPRARARRRTQLIGAVAGFAAIVIAVTALWGISFVRNRAFQADMAVKAAAARDLAGKSGVDLKEVSGEDADLTAALPLLDALRDLPWGYAATRQGGPPLTMRFGLFQSGLAAQGENAYRDALRRVMLPRLLLRLEGVLREKSNDPQGLYEPLKVYLMLGGQGPMDTGTVKTWVTTDWATAQFVGADRGPERTRLRKHLDALLEDKDISTVWAESRAPLDGTLIAAARQQVQTMSLGQRAYAVLKQKAAGSGGDPWLMADALSPGDARAFANPDAVMAIQIPYFFTRKGYEKAYLLGLPTIQADMKRDLWVMGESQDSSSIQGELGNLRGQIAGFYATEYNDAWEKLVAALQPAAYFSDPVALGAATKSPSPLKKVLSELRKNTSFEGGGAAVVGRLARDRLNRSRAGIYVGEAVDGKSTGLDAGALIAANFADVHEFVGDGKSAAPVDDFFAALKQAATAKGAVDVSNGIAGSESNQTALAQAQSQMQTAAAGAPPLLKPFVDSAAKGGAAAVVISQTGAVTTDYTMGVLPACKEAAEERYPFFADAVQDAPVLETMRAFGGGQIIDTFVRTRLMPLLDLSGPIWRWKAGNPVTATFDPTSPEQFTRARQIGDLLATGLPLKISLVALGTELKAAEFSTNGVVLRFTRAGTEPKEVTWTLQGTQGAAVNLYVDPAADPARSFTGKGPWALFRLMDQAETGNRGVQGTLATFGQGAQAVTFLIERPSDSNPLEQKKKFWKFRCPMTL